MSSRGPRPPVFGGRGPLDDTLDYLRFVLDVAVRCREAGLSPLEAARSTDLGRFAAWPDAERIVGNLHRACAELRYHRNGNRLALIHTEVPEELEGRGFGGRLVIAAVDRAAREGLTIVPYCPFARGWLERHSDVADRAAIDWRAVLGTAAGGHGSPMPGRRSPARLRPGR